MLSKRSSLERIGSSWERAIVIVATFLFLFFPGRKETESYFFFFFFFFFIFIRGMKRPMLKKDMNNQFNDSARYVSSPWTSYNMNDTCRFMCRRQWFCLTRQTIVHAWEGDHELPRAPLTWSWPVFFCQNSEITKKKKKKKCG